MIFSLTDETYSLVCLELPRVPLEERDRYYFLVSLFDHSYWVVGTAIGAIFGSLIEFNSKGIEIALTAAHFRYQLFAGSSPHLKFAVTSFLLPLDKNPECESVRDFYFLPLHYSLFIRERNRDFWQVRSNSEK